MNAINFQIQIIEEATIDGIQLESCILIKLFLNSDQYCFSEFFEDSYLIYDQLIKSTEKSGDYYLFSGLSGVLEEDGWECPAKVNIEANQIKWRLIRGGKNLNFEFSAKGYRNKVADLVNEVARLNLKVEPNKIFFE